MLEELEKLERRNSTPAAALRVYLAGRMTGLPADNYPAFHAAAARLRARGHIVISPAELHPLESIAHLSGKARWNHCMKIDIPHLLSCDLIALLPDWEKSAGTRLEVHTAWKLDIPIYDEATWTRLNGRRALIRELIECPEVA